MRPRFQLKDRTKRQSHDMIQMMAKHGDNPFVRMGRRLETDADVKRLFASQGHDYADAVQRCRKSDARVPFIENHLGSIWTAFGDAEGSVSVVKAETGDEITRLERAGSVAMSIYWQLFEGAVDSFSQCLESGALPSFQSWLSSGIASIEAYITHRALIYSSSHPNDQLVDSREHKVSFNEKIDDWIPKMSGEKKLNRSLQTWEHLKILRAARGEWAIHPKKPSLGIEFEEMCKLLNLFRSGIAGFLVHLHRHFDERIPSVVVRYAHLGDIELVEEETP